MKRNMELVREILLALEEHPHGYAPRKLEVEGFSEDEVGYHCFLLKQAGLINAADFSAWDSKSPVATPVNLTWEGHEFLANIKDENVWRKSAAFIKEKTGDASIAIWAGVAQQFIQKSLGL